MKQISLLLGLSFFSMMAMAQNNFLQVNYGVSMALGSPQHQAWRPADGWGFSVLHQSVSNRFKFGLSYDKQDFHSDRDYFSGDYKSSLSVRNFLLVFLPKIYADSTLGIYGGPVLGFNSSMQRWDKAGQARQTDDNGLSAGLQLQLLFRTGRRTHLFVNSSWMYAQVQDVAYDQNPAADGLGFMSLKLGMEWQLGRK